MATEHRERGSSLMLMPAAVLVVMVLGAIAVDQSLVYTRQRELVAAAEAAANDAAGYGLDRDAFYERNEFRVRPRSGSRRRLGALRARGSRRRPTVSLSPDGDEVEVRARRPTSPYLFAAAIPGAPRTTRGPRHCVRRAPPQLTGVRHSSFMLFHVVSQVHDDHRGGGRRPGERSRRSSSERRPARRHPPGPRGRGARRGPRRLASSSCCGFEADADGAELRLTWAGHHTLATLGRSRPRAAADLVATLADTVARLHGLRIAHTRLTADHVVLGADEQPILCGFSRACRGDPQRHRGRRRRARRPARPAGRPRTPTRRPSSRIDVRRHRSEPERAALLTLADRAAAEASAVDRARPPSPRRSATSSRRPGRLAAPGDRRPRARRPPTGAGPRRWWSSAPPSCSQRRAGLLGDDRSPDRTASRLGDRPPIGIVDPNPVVAADHVLDARRLQRDYADVRRPLTAATPVPTSLPRRRHRRRRLPGAVRGRRLDRHASTGAPTRSAGSGDLVAVADWDCDGRATPALVRPSTGEVFVFAELGPTDARRSPFARPPSSAARPASEPAATTVPGPRRDPTGRHDRGRADRSHELHASGPEPSWWRGASPRHRSPCSSRSATGHCPPRR